MTSRTFFSLLIFLAALLSGKPAAGQSNPCFLLISSTENPAPGQTACVKLSARGFTDILSGQFTLEWDASKVEFEGLEFGANPLGLAQNQNFGVSAAASGILRFSWVDPTVTGTTLPDDAVLFQVCLKAIGDVGESASFRITGSPVPFEVVDEQFVEKPMNQVLGSVNIGGIPPPSGGFAIADACTSPAGCTGSSGSINVSVADGTPPYSFFWTGNNGFSASTEDLTGLPAGIYFLTVSDGGGGTAKAQFVVESANSPVSVWDVAWSDAICPDNNGSIFPTAFSPNPPLTWLWSNGATSQNLENLAPGEYSVSVTDALGCIGFKTVTIGLESDMEILVDASAPDCHGGPAFGSLLATISGGVPPYQFVWSNGAQTPDIQGLEPGNYALVVTDFEGCTKSGFYTIDDFTTDAWQTAILKKCPGTDSTGQIIVVVEDSPAIEGPLTFAWSEGSVSVRSLGSGQNAYRDSLLGVPSGAYSVTISDAGGCSKVLSTVLDCLSPSNAGNCFLIEVADLPAERGETVCVPVKAQGFDGIVSFQFTLEWDSAALDFVEVKNFNLQGLSVANFNVLGNLGSKLPVSWLDFDNGGETLTDGSTVFEACWLIRPDAPGDAAQVVFTENPALFEVSVGGDIVQNFAAVPGTLTFGPLANQLRLGACTVRSDCANDGKGTVRLFVNGTDLPYAVSWKHDGQISNGSPDDLLALAPGTYDLTVTDAADKKGYATFNFPRLANSECVWPGDADNNNATNHFDALYLGLGYGFSGPARAQNALWTGQNADDWAQNTPKRGVNFKNMDTNGDGQINAADTLAILQNWGKVIRPFYDNPDDAPFSGVDSTLGAPFFLPADTLQEGQAAALPVVLGEAGKPMTDLYGVAFSVYFDPLVVKPNRTRFVPAAGSWLGEPSDLLVVQRDFHGAGRLDVTVTRKDRLPMTGFGTVGELFIVIEDDIFALKDGSNDPDFSSIDTLSPTFLQIARVRAIDAGENLLPIAPRETKLQISQKLVGVSQPGLPAGALRLSPNPADNLLKINASGFEILSLEVLDVAGFVRKKLEIGGASVGHLNTADLSAGTWFLRVRTARGAAVAKFSVQH